MDTVQDTRDGPGQHTRQLCINWFNRIRYYIVIYTTLSTALHYERLQTEIRQILRDNQEAVLVLKLLVCYNCMNHEHNHGCMYTTMNTTW